MFKTFIVAVVLVGASLASQAQISKEELAIVKGIFGMDKREIVTTTIKMTQSDSLKFWPVFDQYENERKALSLARIKLVHAFVSQYPDFTDEEINELMEGAIELEANQLKLMETYYYKFKKVAAAMVAGQWLQVESYINLAVKLAVQEKLPFIGDIKLKPLKK